METLRSQNFKVSRVHHCRSEYANPVAIDVKSRLVMIAIRALSDLVSRLKVPKVSIGCVHNNAIPGIKIDVQGTNLCHRFAGC